ncbi:peptidoglycan DD-metalloendopeptidase family protein [Streptomyces sp. WMMB303]|uniref:M23 family metallopeptidase n=1 Tax=Streptomyces sp. WMMB303 TaxID=3034154 RepID=UPI0023ED39B6|nr:peptidoglycan DD-metalloendopeptidase family protein [Streptomyces sp. WMMB303]MDF4250820.1 peptidoglycan DD-metalloendopeptidase family protein [Streptomyces sp. WMMB303]
MARTGTGNTRTTAAPRRRSRPLVGCTLAAVTLLALPAPFLALTATSSHSPAPPQRSGSSAPPAAPAAPHASSAPGRAAPGGAEPQADGRRSLVPRLVAPPGPSRTSGAPGTEAGGTRSSGPSGPPGTSGTTGPPGASGPSGDPGAPGDTGAARAESDPAEPAAPADPPSTAESGWVSPVTEFPVRISQAYGVEGGWAAGYHTGVDLAVRVGTPVRSVGPGTVVAAGWAGDYGKAVTVRMEDGKYLLFAHLSEVFVREGATVRAGTWLGRSGNTGHSTGPHLHFEVREQRGYGSDIDPVRYLADHGVRLG